MWQWVIPLTFFLLALIVSLNLKKNLYVSNYRIIMTIVFIGTIFLATGLGVQFYGMWQGEQFKTALKEFAVLYPNVSVSEFGKVIKIVEESAFWRGFARGVITTSASLMILATLPLKNLMKTGIQQPQAMNYPQQGFNNPYQNQPLRQPINPNPLNQNMPQIPQPQTIIRKKEEEIKEKQEEKSQLQEIKPVKRDVIMAVPENYQEQEPQEEIKQEEIQEQQVNEKEEKAVQEKPVKKDVEKEIEQKLDHIEELTNLLVEKVMAKLEERMNGDKVIRKKKKR